MGVLILDRIKQTVVSWPRNPDRAAFHLYLRPDKTDLDLVKGIPNENEPLEIDDLPHDITVLDLGAHIGGFVCWVAYNYDVGKIVAVEPFPDNFKLLKRNKQTIIMTEVVLIQAAVVSDPKVKTVDLYVANKRSHGRHSIRPTRGRDAISVAAISFSDLLEMYQPTVVKIDVEGAEYEYKKQLSNLPSFVKRLSIEFHFFKPRDLKSCNRLIKRIVKQGFKVVRKPKFGPKSRNGVVVFLR